MNHSTWPHGFSYSEVELASYNSQDSFLAVGRVALAVDIAS